MPTQPVTNSNSADGMTFDSAPVSQPTPVGALDPHDAASASPASSNQTDGGMTFDAAPVAQATSTAALNAGIPHGTLTATPQPHGVAANVEQWADQVKQDLLTGSTQTKVGQLLHFLGAPGLASGVSPQVADLMGSELLGPTQVLKGEAQLPQSGKRWSGVKNVIGGALDTLTIPSSVITPEAGELGGAGTEAAIEAGGRAAKATGRAIASAPSKVHDLFNLQAVQDALENSHGDIQKSLETGTQAIQDDWHQTVRDIFDRVAQEAGVTPQKAESLHDVAANVSAAVKAKAQGLYKQADAAVGGTRFQSYQGAVKNIRNAIREEVGLDPERDAQLQQRLADAQAGHEAAKETLVAKGLDPGIIDSADALYTKAMALADTSKPIQASIAGLRADLHGAGAAAESLSPAKLALRVNKLYDRGRLQQALGEGGSSDLLTAIEDTKQRLKDLANGAKQQAQAVKTKAAQEMARVQANRNATKYAAGAALGSVPGYELLKHLLGV